MSILVDLCVVVAHNHFPVILPAGNAFIGLQNLGYWVQSMLGFPVSFIHPSPYPLRFHDAHFIEFIISLILSAIYVIQESFGSDGGKEEGS